MDIITPKEKELYKEYINRILSSRKNLKDKKSYQERHHIVPKTLGGTNMKSNLIYLYAQEHYYAHKLLAKEYPNEQGLQLAWWNMCQCTQHGERQYDITADDYADARERAARANSNIRKGMQFSEEHKKNLCGHGKAVVNITTGETFASAKEAGEKMGINAGHIGECCRGQIPSAGRDIDGSPYIWRYNGEENIDFDFNDFHIFNKIICIETGEIYESSREASRQTGVGRTTIRSDCKKTSSRQNINRLHFAYLKNEMNDSNK